MDSIYQPIGMQPQFQGYAPGPNSPIGNGQRLDPALIQAVLGLQNQQSGMADIQRQQQLAQAIRKQGIEGMQSISPGGGRAGPPNWAGALANVYSQYKAGQMDKAANAQRAQLDQQRQDALARYLQAMTGGNRPQSYPGSDYGPE